MYVKRALSVLAIAIATGGVGSAVIVGTSASGSPRPLAALPPQAPDVAPPAPHAPHTQAMPKTKLHLPSTLRLVYRTTGARPLDRSHTVFTAALTKPGHKKIIGTAAYSCTAVTSGGLHQDCRGALALRKGVLLVAETQNISTGQITGSVLGGSGYYSGAIGPISGHDIGGGRAKLAVHYSFQ